MTTTIPTPQLRPHTPTCLTCRTPKNAKRQALSQNQVQITLAMLLRAENVDIHTIALWLGHESTKSTEPYLHADNKLKQRAIERIAPTRTRPGRYRPSDRVMAFLEGL